MVRPPPVVQILSKGFRLHEEARHAQREQAVVDGLVAWFELELTHDHILGVPAQGTQYRLDKRGLCVLLVEAVGGRTGNPGAHVLQGSGEGSVMEVIVAD